MVHVQNLKRASIPTEQQRNVLEPARRRIENTYAGCLKARVGVSRDHGPRTKRTRAVCVSYAPEMDLDVWYLSAAAAWSYVRARLHLHHRFVFQPVCV